MSSLLTKSDKYQNPMNWVNHFVVSALFVIFFFSLYMCASVCEGCNIIIGIYKRIIGMVTVDKF